jgi:hypothetical protein
MAQRSGFVFRPCKTNLRASGATFDHQRSVAESSPHNCCGKGLGKDREPTICAAVRELGVFLSLGMP